MSKLYKITIEKRMVNKTSTEWNGRDSDELCGDIEVTKTIQEGWNICSGEYAYSFEEEELKFLKSYDLYEKAVGDLVSLGIMLNTEISKEVLLTSGVKYIPDAYKEIVLSDKDAEYEIIEEEFFVFVREGMSTRLQFSREPILKAPIKSNRKGLSVRGYAASLVWSELNEDHEFYSYIYHLIHE